MKVINKTYYVAIIALIISFALPDLLYAQNDNIYNEMSLDELLDVDIVVTATKRPEDLFETPLSVTIIKQEDIINSGATCIPEALRLAPGLIVREQTPGNFDVHIRGFEDITKGTYMPLPNNTIILVMINYSISYSYYSGGTFWETLPVGIEDIERIEVVRGPASALYGPNAAAGVINIITTHAVKEKLNARIGLEIGNGNSLKGNAAVGYNWDDKTKFSVSANYMQRNRIQNDYYRLVDKSYGKLAGHDLVLPIVTDTISNQIMNAEDIMNGLNAKYDDKLGVVKGGVNLFFDHNFLNNSSFKFVAGYQQSKAKKALFTTFSQPYTDNSSNSYYANSELNLGDFHLNSTLKGGEYNSNYNYHNNRYLIYDASIEYDIFLASFIFRPGISYRSVKYESPVINEQSYYYSSFDTKFTGDSRLITSAAFSLLADWKISSNLRLVSGFRADKFNNDFNENLSLTWQVAGTYRLNKDNFLRSVYSTANRSPFIFDSYLNVEMDAYWGLLFAELNDPVPTPVKIYLKGQPNNKLLSVNSFELGWRSKLSSKLDLDFTAYTSNLKNPVGTICSTNVYVDITYGNNFQIESILNTDAEASVIYDNWEGISIRQYGVDFNLSYKAMKNLQLQLHGSVQFQSYKGLETLNEPNYDTTIVAFNQAARTATLSMHGTINPNYLTEKTTPQFYGGLVLNYSPIDKLTINLNSYFMTKQKFIGEIIDSFGGSYTVKTTGYYEMDIAPYYNINLKLQYKLFKNLSLSASARNILGEHKEYGFADDIGRMFMVGCRFSY